MLKLLPQFGAQVAWYELHDPHEQLVESDETWWVLGQLEPHWLKLVRLVCFTPVTESQESVVHELPSSMFTGVWVTAPLLVLQASVVQASLSVTLTAVCLTPVTGSHESVVQALLSLS